MSFRASYIPALLIPLLVFIISCSSSDDNDKYSLVTSNDRKQISKICGCVEPLTPYMEKIMNTKDSLEAMMYADSLEILGSNLAPCLGDAQTLEDKSLRNEKFTKQFIEYIREKHPKCLPFFLGVKMKEER